MSVESWFRLDGKVAVVTGGTGALGSAVARGLVAAGARVAVLARNAEKVKERAGGLGAEGGEAIGLVGDVLERDSLLGARDQLLERWGRVDILVNAAGGNVAGATLKPGESVFGLSEDAFREVFDLNLIGTLLPTQVFGAAMADSARERGEEPAGSVVNISSMAAVRVVTRTVGYSAAKAAIDNLTRWLAVELARNNSPGLRVNAIAPGFFVGEQNRALLLEPDGGLTERGRTIVEHTPAARFGEPDELVSTVVWLCGPGASFVTGVVVPVDGGFSAFSGV
jgi:NAD(P)-dependent dehydrogenase (short-subunit alcohol dehydrogenase family)